MYNGNITTSATFTFDDPWYEAASNMTTETYVQVYDRVLPIPRTAFYCNGLHEAVEAFTAAVAYWSVGESRRLAVGALPTPILVQQVRALAVPLLLFKLRCPTRRAPRRWFVGRRRRKR